MGIRNTDAEIHCTACYVLYTRWYKYIYIVYVHATVLNNKHKLKMNRPWSGHLYVVHMHELNL